MMANVRWPSEWEMDPDDLSSIAMRPDMLMWVAERAAATAFARACCSKSSRTNGCDTAWVSLEITLIEEAVATLAAEEEIDAWTALFIERGAFNADCALAAAEFRERYNAAMP
jgi:hypothetical protein